MIVAFVRGSSIASMFDASGSISGLSMAITSPERSRTRYSTVGAVVISERLNSRSRRSCTISMCSRPEEAAAEPESERRRRLRLEDQRRVVEVEPLQRLLEVGDVVGVDREDARVDHRRDRAVSRQRMRGRVRGVGHRVADLAVANVLDRRDEVTDLTARQLVDRRHRRCENAHLVDDELAPVVHHPDAHAPRRCAPSTMRT